MVFEFYRIGTSVYIGKYIHHHPQNRTLLWLIPRFALDTHSPSNSARDH